MSFKNVNDLLFNIGLFQYTRQLRFITFNGNGPYEGNETREAFCPKSTRDQTILERLEQIIKNRGSSNATQKT